MTYRELNDAQISICCSLFLNKEEYDKYGKKDTSYSLMFDCFYIYAWFCASSRAYDDLFINFKKFLEINNLLDITEDYLDGSTVMPLNKRISLIVSILD